MNKRTEPRRAPTAPPPGRSWEDLFEYAEQLLGGG